MDLTAQILLQIAAVETSTADLSSTVTTTNINQSLSLATGTGANQAQVVWSDSRTLAADGDYEDLDLSALTDSRGTVAFSAIKVIYIRLTSGSLGIGADASTNFPANPWSYAPLQQSSGMPVQFPLVAGSTFVISTGSAGGIPVSSGSRVLRLTARLDPASYDILLIGEGSIT